MLNLLISAFHNLTLETSECLQVRSMKDNVGDQEEATASTAVQMAGLNAVPVAGDDFTVATSLDEVGCVLLLMSFTVNMVSQCHAFVRGLHSYTVVTAAQSQTDTLMG